MGVYMGHFQFFHRHSANRRRNSRQPGNGLLPEGKQLTAVVFGGVCVLVADILSLFLRRTQVVPRRLQMVAEEKGMPPTLTPPETPITSE